MKGLLIKDFCLTFKNRRLIGVLVFMIIFVYLMQEENAGSFIISFVTMLGGMLVLSTISTDEFDKSSMFLMTMPIKRSTYALEKYVFSFGCSLIFWGASTVICCIMDGSSGVETVKMAVVLLLIISLFQLLMIPVQLRFGGENGRMALMGVVLAVLGIAFAVSRLGKLAFGEEEIQLWYQGMLRLLDSLSDAYIMAAAVAGWIICFVISTRISIRVIEKREY